jgi:beta-phosphoglucomutase-like phosphatase (HAD superfamily)
MTLSLVIFDCDGVLIDSEMIACSVLASVLGRFGYDISPEEVARRFAGVSPLDIRSAIEGEIGRTLPADLESCVTEGLKVEYPKCLMPIPNISTQLDELDASNIRWCVASSSPPDRLQIALKTVGLWDRASPNVFSAALVRSGKPAPDLFLFAASKMSAPPSRCLVVEDTVVGVEAAKAAGMKAIGFAGASHCKPELPRSLMGAGADAVLCQFPGLFKYL